MKRITKDSRKRRFGVPCKLVQSTGDKVRVQYACPKNNNDRKRWGREMAIVTDSVTLKLDGRGINAIKSVLEKAGELS